MGSIYKITNTVNGMVYIGKSMHDAVKTRINKHLSGKGNEYLKNAVKKHGVEVFAYEILHDGILPEFLDMLEMEEIAKHNCVRPNGFNLTHGGDGGIPSEETRRKRSESLKGEKNPMFGKTGEKNPMFGRTGEKNPNYGKPRPEETRQKISKANSGEKNPMFGRPPTKGFLGKRHSEESLQKMSKAQKGRKHTEETRSKISESKKGENHPNYGKPAPNKGKPLSEETRRRISESKETPERTAARKFFCSLPSEMSLKEKRKILRQKFPDKRSNRIYSWCQKFDSET